MPSPYDQIAEKLRAATASTSRYGTPQAIACFVLIGIAIAVAITISMKGTTPQLATLFEDRALTPTQIERIEAALGDATLTDYVFDHGQIRVPAENRGLYLSAIREANASPATFHSPTEEAIQNASLIETSRHRSQRLHFALEKEARLAICELPGVLDAFVHIDVATDRSIRMRTQSTAVVGVKTAPGAPLDEQSFRTIHAMLLNFKAGLAPESVTITDLSTRQFFRGSMDNQSAASIAALRKADLERSWQRKLASAIPFATDAQLTVQVIPAEDGLEAKHVACSVLVPRTAFSGATKKNIAHVESSVRERIQSALLPLLPNQRDDINQLIGVTLFDEPNIAETQIPDWQRLSTSPNLLAALLAALAGIMALFLLKSPPRPVHQVPTAQEQEPHLRLYEGHELGPAETAQQPSVEQLQTIATEDPHAVADSLSDFIDRAS